MIFATYWFLLWAACFFVVFYCVKFPIVRFVCLLAFCFLFHAHFAGAAGMAPIICLFLMTFLVGLFGERRHNTIAIVVCVVALFAYKYHHFFCTQIFPVLIGPDWALDFDQYLTATLPVTPPLAISFFVFEFVHYLFEVRRGATPVRNIFDFAAFTFFFPSLVAGPIKRYGQFLPSLKEGLKSVSTNDVMLGLLLVTSGFVKKLILADTLTAYIASRQDLFTSLVLQERWLVVLAIGFRIYLDFSGYSDIAIGLARMMGIQLPANFNWPYLAVNLKDFWQRWHISLSTWIRDYVYIPLGGNRMGTQRMLLNGVAAFALCGFWHGADWHYILWGLYHGVGFAICLTYRRFSFTKWIGAVLDKLPILSWAITMAFVFFGWLLFFYPVDRAMSMFASLWRVG